MDHDFQITELVLDDAPHLTELMIGNKDRFRRFFPRTMAQNMNVSASGAYIARKKVERENNTEFTYAVREPLQQKVVGLAIIKEIDWAEKTAELAYCIGKAYEGRGWMTQAIKTMVAISLDELRMQTLKIVVHHGNVASIAVAKNCGFIWEKSLPNGYILPGEAVLDMELYVRHSPNGL